MKRDAPKSAGEQAAEPEAARALRRSHLAQIRQAALEAVEPQRAVLATLRHTGDDLRIGGAISGTGDRTLDLTRIDRIFVLGAGKAGAPMAQAVESLLGDRIHGGIVVVKEGHGAPTRLVQLREAGHPVPTQAGLDAGAELFALAGIAGANDLVICLLSGGGSALLELLPPGITLADLQATTQLLLASGATIGQVNTLRKHLSLVKGGRLAAEVAPAALVTLVLSDVVGSPLDVIASGPTVTDSSSWADAWAVVEVLALQERLPPAVVAHLRAGVQGALPDTPRASDPVFARATAHIVADNRVAAEAARQSAEGLGYHAQVVTTTLEGEARTVAGVLVEEALQLQRERAPSDPPGCLIWGGETTVTLGAQPGKGGRNQELALAAALALEGSRGITLMALATDGTDGPTDSAGAVVDGSSAQAARDLGLEPEAALAAHDAYPLLAATGDLLRTGPTRTNVNDLIVALVA
jgi:hydroxypyruvate reductase